MTFLRRLRVPAMTLLGVVFLLSFRPSDDPFVDRLVARLTAYIQQFPTEKVYLQTDRDRYLPGETIWMSGYLFNGITHGIDSVSGVVYVELIEPVGRRLVLNARLQALGGQAPGQLLLPDSLRAGRYQLRAFTNYMRNFSDEYFFTKTVTVLPAAGTAPAAQLRVVPTIDVQFLPEGGQLVAGLTSRIAFKAVDQSGRGRDVTGYILDAKGDTAVGFSSQQRGMGFLNFQPEAGQTYTAFVRQADGTSTRAAFPAVQPAGYVLTVDNTTNKDNIRVFLTRTPAQATAGTPGQLTLLAQTRGAVVQVAKVPAGKTAALIQLPRAQFPEGIAQLTLFSEAGVPVCERLVFVDRSNRLKINVTPAKDRVKSREKVALDVTVTDANDQPVSAVLSMAVTDQGLIPADTNGATLVSHLLLSSDLAGEVEQPGAYFDPANKARLAQLDLLMMTQGWRRFTWQQVLTDSLRNITHPLESGLSLTGRVVRPNQKTAGKVRLTFLISLRDSSRTVLSGESDEQGRYGAYGLNFTDSASVLIQAVRGKNDRAIDISLDQLLKPTVVVTRIPFAPVEFGQSEYEEFVRRTREYLAIERQIRNNREVLLSEVTVKAKRTVERDSRKIYGNADATVKFDPLNTAGAVSVLDVIRGRVAGVQVLGSGFNTTVQIRGVSSISGSSEPLFVLDGIPTAKETIFAIPVGDVDYVDVLKGPSAAIYGSQGAGGVIIVMTKRGSPNLDYSKDPVAGSLLAKIAGYTPVREFYAPRYDVAKPEHTGTPDRGTPDRRPDYRATLHWTPLLRTNAAGKAIVSFFASDAKTTLHIVTEGISGDGRPGTTSASVRIE